MTKVYIFNGQNSTFPSGVFTTYELAAKWISKNKLSGILNAFPLNTGLYDWAISNGLFQPKKEQQLTPTFIEKFSCAGMEHFHFENGKLEG